MKTYRYKGYDIVLTYPTTTKIYKTPTGKTYEKIRPLYEIVGLKPAVKYPYCTTVKECKEYIDFQIILKEC